MQNNYDSFFKGINYKFKDLDLLKLALTHPSYANEHNIDKIMTNQRLEFLGDAVLEMISSDFLYKKFTDVDEGKLTKIRAKLVCEESLSDVARSINLHEYLLIGKGESKERVKNNNSIMCDAVEALIAGIYIDSGIEEASDFIKTFILTSDNLNKSNSDYKSIIQEISNAKSKSLRYELVYEKGPDHNKEFSIDIYYDDKLYGNGIGKSKKEAEQNAAKVALEKIKDN